MKKGIFELWDPNIVQLELMANNKCKHECTIGVRRMYDVPDKFYLYGLLRLPSHKKTTVI